MKRFGNLNNKILLRYYSENKNRGDVSTLSTPNLFNSLNTFQCPEHTNIPHPGSNSGVSRQNLDLGISRTTSSLFTCNLQNF